MPIEQKSNSQQGSPFELITNSKPKKITPKNIIIAATILIFLGVSIFLGVYLVGKQTNISEKASPATAIFMTPGSQTKSAGQSFTFTVGMDTATNSVTGIDVRLNFDPSVMQVVSVQQGAGITNLDQTITNTYDNLTGKIAYSVFTLNSSKSVIGSGIEVLKINATVKSSATAGSYNITFDPATAASATQEGQNVLVSKSQSILVISGATSVASPTVVPTPTNVGATVRPTATATARATTTASPRVSASPTVVPTPTTVGSTPAPTAAPTAVATTKPTNQPAQSSPLPIPVTGTDWPTYLGFGFGVFVVIASIVLAI